MEFTWKGKKACLSVNLVTKPGQMTYNQLCALLHSESVSDFYTLQAVDARSTTTEFAQWLELSGSLASLPLAKQKLLMQYKAVFNTPQCLPPFRSVDHHIHLQPGSSPVNVHPYR